MLFFIGSLKQTVQGKWFVEISPITKNKLLRNKMLRYQKTHVDLIQIA